MGSAVDNTPATRESVWESFREAERLRKESEARFEHEMAVSRAAFDRRMTESDAAFEKSCAEFDKRMAELSRHIDGMSKSNGLFAEDYFFNSFERGQQTFFGEKFDDIRRNVSTLVIGSKDEYDIVMLNGKSVGIVEIKYRARKDDIAQIIRKAKTFRSNFPNYRKHQLYLALASLTFSQQLEGECIKKGIAIVKQVGDTVVINDKHLKIY